MAKRATTTPLEQTIRENIQRIVDVHFNGKLGQVARLHKKSVVLSRLQAFMDGGTAHLSKLQPWADALGVKPHHLLIKNLDVDDLPELVSGKRLRRLEKLRDELIEENAGETDSERTLGDRTPPPA